MSYDYIIVGAGLFGSVVADALVTEGYKVLVVDRRNTVGGNVYTEDVDGIQVHKYGAHIFRTNDKFIWDYVNSFVPFNSFINSPIAVNGDSVYNLPFNMNTFAQLWGVQTPRQARAKIDLQTRPYKTDSPKNLEEFALSTVGPDIYYTLIKCYTEKQWGKKCTELPVSIMRRIPLRFTFDNNYYSAKYQGIPETGYTPIIEQMLVNCDVKLGVDGKEFLHSDVPVIYTGCIDEAFDYRLGKLEYRSLRFEEMRLNMENFQGNAVVNFTDSVRPYTRIIEHKHFTGVKTDFTLISIEYPTDVGEQCYPIESEINLNLYNEYLKLSKELPNITFCGRLGNYKYTDMEETIKSALQLSKNLIRR